METVTQQHNTVQPRLNLDALIQQLQEEPDSRNRLVSVLAGNGHALHRPTMSYEEFLDWADEDTLAEWVNGEIIMSSPASLPHQKIADFLVSIIGMFVTSRNLGIVLSAPFQMKMEHGREPDLLFVAEEHRERLRGTYLDGPADLVVEIMSPESIGRDRGEKFYEYERGGIPEYWLIDPLTQRAEFYQYDAEPHRYTLTPLDAGDRYRSVILPGFWLRSAWLWQEPLPHPLAALGEIAGIDSHEVSRFMRLLQGNS